MTQTEQAVNTVTIRLGDRLPTEMRIGEPLPRALYQLVEDDDQAQNLDQWESLRVMTNFRAVIAMIAASVAIASGAVWIVIQICGGGQ